jgi:hypothetical protein
MKDLTQGMTAVSAMSESPTSVLCPHLHEHFTYATIKTDTEQAPSKSTNSYFANPHCKFHSMHGMMYIMPCIEHIMPCMYTYNMLVAFCAQAHVAQTLLNRLSTHCLTESTVKPRNIPIQLLNSGDRSGEGLHAQGSRMLIDARTRKGPFFHRSQRAGAWCFTHYNNMYHPRCVISREEGGMDAEYEQLCKRVALINVAVERQIQVKGPDAEKFVDLVITRKASAIKVHTAKYVILCNGDGGIINDPVLLRLAEDEFWFSMADSGAGLYLQGVNAMGTYDVTIREIDVAPLSVAGPHALKTIRSLIGESADDIPYFGLVEAEIAGCSTVVTRTGFSAEKNFEIFLREAHRNADTLYDAVMAAGAPFGIREIAIPHHSRIEGGMLSYGQDMDIEVCCFVLLKA